MSAPASPDQEWTGDQDNQQQAEESFDQNRAEEEETPDENAPHSPEYAPSPDGPASPDNGNDYPGSPGETQEVSNQMAAEKETRDEDERRAQQNHAGSDKDSDDELNIRRKRILDSDDEEGETKVSPSKKKITVSSDEDSDNERAKPKGKLLSDQSDDSGNEGRKGGEEVGELMANIFGEDSDEDEDNEFKEKPVNDEEEDEDRNERPPRDDDEDDRPSRDPGHEWDFDEMMKRKKAERKRQRKRRGDGVDIINDDDGRIALMVEKMKAATKDDRIANQNRMPALKKRKMLAEVKMMLLRTEMYEAIIENGMMSAVSDWLAPLPDKSLPALEIRTDLLKLLCDSFSRLDQGVLKQSGLGRAVMMLYKHPKELKPNKEMASKLIREWSRPIFQLDTDFRSVTREERESRDQERMPEAKRRRLSVEGATSSKKAEEAAKEPQINRARVPRVSTKDYVVRPKHLVEGEFKGEKKGRAYDRLNKAQRDFQERTKKMKVKRAVQVSLEGRNMAI